jgi:hypothetical protein
VGPSLQMALDVPKDEALVIAWLDRAAGQGSGMHIFCAAGCEIGAIPRFPSPQFPWPRFLRRSWTAESCHEQVRSHVAGEFLRAYKSLF